MKFKRYTIYEGVFPKTFRDFYNNLSCLGLMIGVCGATAGYFLAEKSNGENLTLGTTLVGLAGLLEFAIGWSLESIDMTRDTIQSLRKKRTT